MIYQLHAMVAAPDVLEPVVERYPHARPVLLDGAELALVPVCEELFRAIDLPGFPPTPESGFTRLSSGIAAILTASSRRGPVAYLEAEYAGDLGHQTAAVWLDCHVVFGPRLLVPGEPFRAGDSPWNGALRYLGVEAVGGVGGADEFVVLGLGRHRSTEDWCAAWSGR